MHSLWYYYIYLANQNKTTVFTKAHCFAHYFTDDRNLPCVPPISISIPENYPDFAPKFDVNEEEYSESNLFNFILNWRKSNNKSTDIW